MKPCEQRHRADGFEWLDERMPSGLTRLQEAERLVPAAEVERMRAEADQLVADYIKEKDDWDGPDAFDKTTFRRLFGPLYKPLKDARSERDVMLDQIRRSLRRLDRLDRKMGQLRRREVAKLREQARLDTAALVLALADADPGSDPRAIVAEWLRGLQGGS